MGVFVNLDDSPMFMKQVSSIEQTCDQVKDRCQILYKGCKKFMAVLGESSNGYQAFADCLEEFGGGRDDPVSVSIGGPVMSKFITALRELAVYKELLRSQVEHTLYDRLTQFLTVDMQEAKESHGRFEKAVRTYDQAREKFVSLKKSTRGDIVEGLEENLLNSKSAFERSRFHLVKTLMNVEAKKKYEFLESMSAMMDAHLRFFKLGYDLLMQMEPYVDQVLTYAQQSREQANVEQDKLEKRIQEFRTQAEINNFEPSSETEPSTGVDGVNNVVCKSSYSSIEAMMQAATCGEVKTIKQGYLLKRSSNMRGDWKRRFFVLDSHGTLYYYRSNGAKPMGFISHQSSSSFDQSGSVFSRFRTRHNRSPSLNEETIGCHTVDLQTSTIKIDAADTDLRLCFRIISPVKTYTLQAENGADRMDWINKITAVITSLLNTNFLQQTQPKTKGLGNSSGFNDYELLDSYENPVNAVNVDQGVSVSKTLREVPGNELCAECSCPEPDWASLNLGILLCIECSGVHRNLGVHISKVRSLSLDVRVWEPTIMDLFRSLGNTYCNSVWEGLLLLEKDSIESMDEVNPIFASVTKPCPQDTFYCKEKYIHAKYVEKSLVVRETTRSGNPPSINIWEAVKSNNLRQVYRLIVTSEVNIVNTIFDDVFGVDLYHHVDAQDSKLERKATSPATCRRIKDTNASESCLQGCSLLHLACHYGHKVMVELLLQFGADANMLDYHGRTPLHHCIFREHNELAKFLIKRGARASTKDAGGLTALERAMEMGAITDEKLFILLTDS